MEDPIGFAASGWVDHAYVGFTGASVCSSSVGNASAEIIATTGVLYGVFYAVRAVTNAWYYRTQLRRGAGDLIIVGVLPLAAAAAFLTWIIVKSVATWNATVMTPRIARSSSTVVLRHSD